MYKLQEKQIQQLPALSLRKAGQRQKYDKTLP